MLLPTDTNKLIAQWQGPYQVIKKMGNVNYQIDMHDHRKRKRIFHVNMLHLWYSTVSNSCFVREASEDPDDLPLWQPQDDLPASVKEPLLGNSLSPEQRLMLKNMLNQHSEVI